MTAPLQQAQAQMRRQLGLLTRQQALEHGLEEHQVRWLVRSGRWRRIGIGVYAIESATPDWRQRALAACLSVEPTATLAFQTAAHLWQLDGFLEAPRIIHVAATSQVRRQLKNVQWHVVRSFAPRDLTELRGLPATSLPRTLVDLASVLDEVALENALDSALRKNHRWKVWLTRELPRFGDRRHGIAVLRRLLTTREQATDSPLEVMVRRLIFAAGLPSPIGQYEVIEQGQLIARVDFGWAERLLVVQAQGYQFHHGRRRFEIDLRQISAMQSYGYLVWQPTMQRIENDLAGAIEELKRMWARAPLRTE